MAQFIGLLSCAYQFEWAKDRFVWRLRKNGDFFLLDLYIERDHEKGDVWWENLVLQGKAPIENKDFSLVYLKRRVVLTKDNLLKGVER